LFTGQEMWLTSANSLVVSHGWPSSTGWVCYGCVTWPVSCDTSWRRTPWPRYQKTSTKFLESQTML